MEQSDGDEQHVDNGISNGKEDAEEEIEEDSYSIEQFDIVKTIGRGEKGFGGKLKEGQILLLEGSPFCFSALCVYLETGVISKLGRGITFGREV